MGSCIRYRRQFGVDECTRYVYANRRLFRVDGGTREHGTGRGIILWVGVDIRRASMGPDVALYFGWV